MKTHNYLTRINDDTWIDLQRVRELDNRSANSLINEGVRLVIAAKVTKDFSNEKTEKHSTRYGVRLNYCSIHFFVVLSYLHFQLLSAIYD